MKEITLPAFSAFDGDRRIAVGPLAEVAGAVKRATDANPGHSILIFDHSTGRSIDIDLRGTQEEVVNRLRAPAEKHFEALPGPNDERGVSAGALRGADSSPPGGAAPRGRGRPKLGVVAREVTLLPRHWQWLNEQPGGASVALRRLVDEARRLNSGRDQRRREIEAAYNFMSAMAGDLPGFEEAARALFAEDRERYLDLIAGWPPDIRDHCTVLTYAVPA